MDTPERLPATSADPEADEAEEATKVAKLAIPRRYHVALTPEEALERLAEQEGVESFARGEVPDFGGVGGTAEYTLEMGTRDFRIHCGPPAARGQSATGMLRMLYIRGHMVPSGGGTRIELRFTYRRPRWALQRWVGFLMLASVGLAWVLVGPGLLAQKALLYGVLLLVLGPVVVHDLRRGDRLEQQRLALLNLVEHSFGPIEIDEPHPDEPYRRRMLVGEGDEDWDDDEDGDSDI